MAKPKKTAPSPARPMDEARALDLVLEMLPIPGLPGKEAEVAGFVTEKLRQAGAPADAIHTDQAHRQSPLGGEIGNLICRLPGTFPAPRRLLMAHLDTVPLCVGTRPVVQNGLVRSGNPATGLGADNRSGSSAILNAAIAIIRRGLPHPPLTFLWTVQEEVGLYGARFVKRAELGNPKLCFNWDGNDPAAITVAATGAYRMEIDIDGVASHAGVAPERGTSAVAIAGLAIADLQQNGWHGRIVKGKRQGTSNIGVLTGGNATNVVTPHVRMRAEVRSHDPAFRQRILQTYERAFHRAARQVRNQDGVPGQVRINAELHYESFRLAEDDPPVLEAQRAARSLGLEPYLKTSNGGLDANWLSARGLPTVTLGAGQQDVHTVDETLHIDSYLAGCRMALALATGR